MNHTTRRTFLKVLGSASVAAASAGPLMRAFADPIVARDEFFLFVHAAGGWDVTLWADPRNERKGLIEPASTDNTRTAGIKQWQDAPLGDGDSTYKLVRPTGSNITFGPAIGDLAELYDRLCLINGIAMNTVSHADGTVFSATGRHLAGGRAPASSIDTIVANEFGRDQLLPLVSARFPSSLVGGAEFDRRVAPLVVDTIGSIGKVLSRSTQWDSDTERDAVTALLSQEASDLAKQAHNPDAFNGMAIQFESLRTMLASNLKDVFDATKLRAAYPAFAFAGKFQGANIVNLAFAIEAMKRNIVRCVSCSFSGFDTHVSNYLDHAATQQEMFDALAAVIRILDATPHPTKMGSKLSDHTHILVVSDFCRTPQVNLGGGRDHYPNNSALIVSPRFRTNTVFGKSDADQLLPANAGAFADGERPIAPPDVLATFVSAFGIDPRKYMRDGEAVRALIAT